MGPGRQVHYRCFRSHDFSALLAMVMDTWRFSDWVPAPAAKAMGIYYLSEILAESNRIIVAETDGEIVGAIAARRLDTQLRRPRYRFLMRCAELRIWFGRCGIPVFHQFVKTEKLDQKLLAHAGNHYDAELTLLLVRKDMNGCGIGSTLYERFLSYIADEGLKSFCLFTDSSCNFRFYEWKGLYRLAHQTFVWYEDDPQDGPTYPEEYYLYGTRDESLP